MGLVDSIDFHYDTTDSAGMSEIEADNGISTFHCFFIILCSEYGYLEGQEVGKGENIDSFLKGYIDKEGNIEISKFYEDNFDFKIHKGDFNESGKEFIDSFYMSDDEDTVDYISCYSQKLVIEDENIENDEYGIFKVKPTKNNYLKLKDFLEKEIFE